MKCRCTVPVAHKATLISLQVHFTLLGSHTSWSTSPNKQDAFLGILEEDKRKPTPAPQVQIHNSCHWSVPLWHLASSLASHPGWLSSCITSSSPSLSLCLRTKDQAPKCLHSRSPFVGCTEAANVPQKQRAVRYTMHYHLGLAPLPFYPSFHLAHLSAIQTQHVSNQMLPFQPPLHKDRRKTAPLTYPHLDQTGSSNLLWVSLAVFGPLCPILTVI